MWAEDEGVAVKQLILQKQRDGFGQHHGPKAGKCLLAGVRKERVNVRRRDRIIEKARDGREQKSLREMWA